MLSTLTLFFVLTPQTAKQALHLVASIRNHLPEDVALIGYCPEDLLPSIPEDVTSSLNRMRCPVAPLRRPDESLPESEDCLRIRAALEPRQTDFSGYISCDSLLLADIRITDLVQDGAVSASMASSLKWGGDAVWKTIYGTFGMEVPAERLPLMRGKKRLVPPYFSAELVLFPQNHRNAEGKSFPEVWHESAQRLAAVDGLEEARSNLAATSLPVAILRAGLRWNVLPEALHYIMGGVIRGEPLPENKIIRLVQYRKWDNLRSSGIEDTARNELHRQAGTAADPRAQSARALADRPLAVVTMVKGDHIFLDLWLRYYGALIGRENLYILRHGDDAEIDRMAEGANIINLPDTGDKSRFDRRRWLALSHVTSSLTLLYDWVLCGDVDEIVAPDPATGGTLVEYLQQLSRQNLPPQTISPFAIELVHTPHSEPEALRPDVNVLSIRRNFRINTNYSKPCLTQRPISFSVGGHGCIYEDVRLDTNLFLFHLRYVDDTISRHRLEARRQWIAAKVGSEEAAKSNNTWSNGVEAFERLSQQDPVSESADFPGIADFMRRGRQSSHGHWFFRVNRSRELYRLPERFSELF